MTMDSACVQLKYIYLPLEYFAKKCTYQLKNPTLFIPKTTKTPEFKGFPFMSLNHICTLRPWKHINGFFAVFLITKVGYTYQRALI